MTEALIALIALSLMEIVLGIDNIVFISVATAKLPKSQQSAGRRLGLLMALVTRVALLVGIYWIAQLITPVFALSDVLPVEGLKAYFMEETESGRLEHSGLLSPVESAKEQQDAPRFDEEGWQEFNSVSWRDIILLAGGLFLIYSSVREIHEEVEVHESHNLGQAKKKVKFWRVVLQIAVMDLIFSLDSVITAVGMAKDLWVMISAIVLAVFVMMLFANQVGEFVDQNPTIKMLALSFLMLIGVMLVAEGIGTPINKGYIYFAMGFSLLVEGFNMRRRGKAAVANPGEA